MKHILLTISLILGTTALGAEPIIGKDDVFHCYFYGGLEEFEALCTILKIVE